MRTPAYASGQAGDGRPPCPGSSSAAGPLRPWPAGPGRYR